MSRQKKKMAVGILLLSLCFAIALIGCGRQPKENQEKESVEGSEIPEEQQSIEQEMLQVGEPDKSTDLSVVLVNDISGSMAASDKERIAIEAAKMFIDMTKNANTRIALVEFSDAAVQDCELKIQDRNQKETLKAALDGIVYRGNTNTGAAMKLASDIMYGMAEQNPDNQKAVILFTDGNTYMGKSGNGLNLSLQQESEAVAALAELDCPIYLVGLNYDGSVDADKLCRYAEYTGGEALIAQDASELPQFFNQIFKKLGNIDDIKTEAFQAGGEFQTVAFDIFNNSIKEANLLILSDQRIQDIRLYSPAGTQMTLDQDDCYSTNSDKYSMIKLVNPEKGSWRADILGASGDSIWISLLYNYDINMIGTLDRKQLYRENEVSAEIYLTSEGQRITEADFYTSMSAYAEVTEISTGENFQVKLSPEGNGMRGSFKLEKLGEHSVAFHIEGQGLYRDSELLYLEVRNRPVKQIQEFPVLQIGAEETIEIDLGEFFVDADGDEISYAYECLDKDILEASIADSVLTVEGVKSGEAQINILASDGYGEEAEALLNGTVTTFFEQWRYVIMGSLAVLLVLLLGTAIHFRPRNPRGYLLISLVHKTPGTPGKSVSNQYKLANGLSMISLGKGVTLARVMEQFAASYRTMASSVKADELDRLLASVSQEMKRVRISPTTDAFRIAVRADGEKVFFSDMAGNRLSFKKKMVECMNGRNSGFCIVLQKNTQTKESVIFTIYYSRDLC